MLEQEAARPEAADTRRATERARSSPSNSLANARVTAGLAAVAVSQPLLDLFGRTPDYFVANNSTDAMILAWAIAVALLPATAVVLLGLAANLGGPRICRVAHRSLVALLGALGAAALIRGLDWAVDADVIFVSAVGGMLIWLAEAHVRWARTTLEWLWPAPVLFLTVFLVASPSGDLLSRGSSEVALQRGGAEVPVVVVVLDELPLSSLLDAELDIDAQMFPAFAELAREANWYRNAVSVSASTTTALPAILAGALPSGSRTATAADHPVSVFSVAGATHEPLVREPVTALCPANVCAGQPAEERVDADILSDTLVVFGHLVLPRGMREDLPRIDQTWGGFAVADAVTGAESSGMADDVLATGSWSPGKEAEGFADLTRELGNSNAEKPPLVVLHALLPHAPWQTTPAGDEYGAGPALSDATGRWLADEELRRLGFRRHLLQLANTDRLLGDLISTMRASGTWDDSLVVVVADHGANFGEGHQRSPNAQSITEVARVPLFVKFPGATQGEVIDEAVTVLDVLPTVASVLGTTDVPGALPGRPLPGTPKAGSGQSSDGTDGDGSETPGTFPGTDFALPEDVADLRPLVDRNRAWLGSAAGTAKVYAVGIADGLLGTEVDALAPTSLDVDVSVDQTTKRTNGTVPAQVTGQVIGLPEDLTVARELAVALNGKLAGSGFLMGSDGRWVALTDEGLWRDDGNSVELLFSDGSKWFTAPVG